MEIISEILVRLPVKFLVRLKCVSKSFLTLISSLQFIHHHHLRFSLKSKSNRLLIFADISGDLYSFELDSPQSPAIKLPFPQNHGKTMFGSLEIVGSCNGLLCVLLHSEENIQRTLHEQLGSLPIKEWIKHVELSMKMAAMLEFSVLNYFSLNVHIRFNGMFLQKATKGAMKLT